ncbi:MAG: hypothetical protein JWM16_1344 [Verrucomicrobiales bacterium]|nr:hypothetical protein [Verrucomicrobiales bacterium]
MLRNGADLGHLGQLDQKLWVALSCPTRGLEFDSKTLDLIDTDKDGRVRVGELVAAVNWTIQNLKNPDDLMKGEKALPLAAINEKSESGAVLLAGARRILSNLGKPDATSISADDLADTKAIFIQTKFNGDGIVPADATSDPELLKVMEDIMACLGSEMDRSSKPGINLPKLELFFTQAQALADWANAGENNPEIMIAGKATASVAAAVRAVRVKVDDYFARCRFAAFDSRATAPLNRAETEFAAMAVKDLSLQSVDIAKFPLARVEPGEPLPLDEGVNPAWAGHLAQLAVDAVEVLFGGKRESLTEDEWTAILQKLVVYENWSSAKPVTALEKLGLERVREILNSGAKEKLTVLIQQDLALEVENAQIIAVETLVRYYRDLKRLVHNYVNFSDFYDPHLPAMFQIGRLYIDARACDLCFHIDDLNKHATLATPSKIYLAYCDIFRPSTKEKRTICAAFTAGFAETLWVGRNGIFYDRQGNDWDAVIVKVVENPISLKEAFWMPWKKLATVISEQFKKLLASREAAVIAAASKSVEEMTKQAESGKPVPPPLPKFDGAAIASSVAAIGIAVGLLSQAAAKLFDASRTIEVWQAVAGVAGVILAVSGPSVILAYFKMRGRDLAPILNACGWAVNSRIRMTLRLGRVLTQEAKIPTGSERQLTDPYAEDNRLRNWFIALLIACGLIYGLWKFELLDEYLPKKLKHFTPPVETKSRETLTVVLPAGTPVTNAPAAK